LLLQVSYLSFHSFPHPVPGARVYPVSFLPSLLPDQDRSSYPVSFRISIDAACIALTSKESTQFTLTLSGIYTIVSRAMGIILFKLLRV